MVELTIQQALQAGINAHRAGNYEAADRYYTAILNAHPQNPDANHNMGVLAVGLGKISEAVPFFRRAVDADPTISQFWLSYIETLMKIDQLNEAKTALNRAIIHNVSNVALEHIKLRLGVPTDNRTNSIVATDPTSDQLSMLSKLYAQGKLEEVLTKCDVLIQKHPNSAVLFNLKGAALLELKKYVKSGISLNKALSLKPDYAEAHFNLGLALQKQGEHTLAIKSVEKAISINPESANAYYSLGNILSECGLFTKAVKAYQSAIFKKPDFFDAYYNMGNAFKKQGKLDEAIGAYKKAVKIQPKLVDAIYNMGNVFREQELLGESIRAYEHVLSIEPNYPQARHMLNALKGETPLTAPRYYVERLFDGYADTFETSLVDDLQYTAPKVLTRLILQDNNQKSLGSVLDLGCGTGLLGEQIEQYCDNLVGIDISNKMLQIAKQKNIYDHLEKNDLGAYLSENFTSFNYFIATDVLIYIGDLDEIFEKIKSNNQIPGKFAFTTEHSQGSGYQLMDSGRYSHSKQYIESQCSRFGFDLIHFSMQDLRSHKGKFIKGGYYILEF